MGDTNEVIYFQCHNCLQLFENIDVLTQHACGTSVELYKNESKRKSGTWSHGMVKALISLYGENKEKFQSPEFTKKRVFEIIAESMRLLQYSDITAEMCMEKWKSLMRTYKNIVDRKKQSGSAAYSFQYYNDMDQILGKDPNIRPPVIYRSSDSGPTYRVDDHNAALSTTNSSKSSQAEYNSEPSLSPPPAAITEPSCSNDKTPSVPRDRTLGVLRGNSNKRNRRELPYWCTAWFSKTETVEEQRRTFMEKQEEAAQKRAEQRQRRHEERQKMHEERMTTRREMIQLLKEIKNKMQK